MDGNATMVIGFVLGAAFLLLALLSTISRITLSLFNPWLLRQVAYRDRPKTFVAVVCLYWFLGGSGLVIAIATAIH